jgi:Cu+-exporting ATPase
MALQLTPGIISARASLGSNAVDIEYQPESTSFQKIRGAIESAGYRVAEPRSHRLKFLIRQRRRLKKNTAT